LLRRGGKIPSISEKGATEERGSALPGRKDDQQGRGRRLGRELIFKRLQGGKSGKRQEKKKGDPIPGGKGRPPWGRDRIFNLPLGRFRDPEPRKKKHSPRSRTKKEEGRSCFKKTQKKKENFLLPVFDSEKCSVHDREDSPTKGGEKEIPLLTPKRGKGAAASHSN